MPLLPTTLSFLREHDLVGRPVVVGVSGGADSVALAHVFTRLMDETHLPAVVLAHINHRLRGQDSDADEAFVQSLPALWSKPRLAVRTQRVDVASVAKAES